MIFYFSNLLTSEKAELSSPATRICYLSYAHSETKTERKAGSVIETVFLSLIKKPLEIKFLRLFEVFRIMLKNINCPYTLSFLIIRDFITDVDGNSKSFMHNLFDILVPLVYILRVSD